MTERVMSAAPGGGMSPGGKADPLSKSPAPHRVLSRWGLLLLRGAQGVLAGLVRRPGRVLGVGVLLALTGLGFGVAGLYVWAGYHLRAARSSLGKYHSSEAFGHLQACLE